ncbi:hypothetical protein RsTz2092_07030 [Deferribacterales bacterium RsTz2092]|nr:hypothetical protein AGMMS49941_07960 [Deferribacterales bacterium]
MVFQAVRAVVANKDKLFKSTSYDVRAFVGEAGHFFEADAVLTPEAMRTIGALMGSMTFQLSDGRERALKVGDSVVVGHDNGPTSKSLSDAFSSGLTEQGINVYYIGVASSGQVYHNQGQLGAAGHVQITRSHVEVSTNGAKFAIGENGIHTYLLGQMNAAISKGTIGRDAPKGQVIDKITEGKKLYVERMLGRYGDYFAKNPRKVALNLFGGTATEYKDMFKSIFGEAVVLLGDKLDVNSGDLLADPTRREMLARVPDFQKTLDDGLRIYSFDLDADRISVSEGKDALRVGGTGHYLGDDMAYILADYKLRKTLPALIANLPDGLPREKADEIMNIASTVYVDPRYSSSVRAFVSKNGGNSEYHRKGHSLWKETMFANMSKLAKLAGFDSVEAFLAKTKYQDCQIEASLHYFVSDIESGSVRDDGLEGVFLFERMCSELGVKTLGGFFVQLDKRFLTKEIRTNSVSNEVKEQITDYVVRELKRLFADKDGYGIVEFDGQVRVDWQTGFIMYGMSNTSPKLTFMVEGATLGERNNALTYILALHNDAKRRFADNVPMDMLENSFFKDDTSFDMSAPDKVDFGDSRAVSFAKEHKLNV